MNHWEVLGLPVQLALTPEEIEAAFRAASEGAHPDAGGEAGQFERLREAHDGLRDEYQRLEQWLRENDVAVAHSGAVSEEVGGMFGRVSEVLAGVDDWLGKGESVSSTLGKALWQKEGFAWKSRVEELLQEVNDWQERVTATFPKLEELARSGDFAEALRVRGELGFLRKWKAQLQAHYGKLWEGLV
ncbi:hypothetical protein [Roseibacillus persicicus]|uniref:hypothetical protein n=1 Tax=Roseibacillus persicicus TaxID=454148 RepID=UPI00280CC578|nr:hypothetical protein [Roseibacillus persicicus]MDQ8189513.1 hypothetical protein [Roseibacillus persicicus]